MGNNARGRGTFGVIMSAGVSLVLALGAGSLTRADDGEWKILVEPVYVSVYGHDQHVLTIHEADLDPPTSDDKTAVTLDAESGTAIRTEVRYARERWGVGLDVFYFLTSQFTNPRNAAAEGPGGTIDAVTFEIADQSYTSTGPSEVLFYDVLEDTDLQTWAVDLYGTRTLASKPNSSVELLFGVKASDFDNDYRAVVGVDGVAGTQLDASSNYDRMQGPLVALAGDIQFGRNHVRGYIGQSVMFGTVEFTGMSRDFTGPFTATPAYFDTETFHKIQDVAIPVTQFRLKWTIRVSKNVALGAGTDVSTWWDVPVPPGVIPGPGGDEVFHENTIVFLGLAGTLELTF